jgi:Dullard-like phosphatase family protein
MQHQISRSISDIEDLLKQVAKLSQPENCPTEEEEFELRGVPTSITHERLSLFPFKQSKKMKSRQNSKDSFSTNDSANSPVKKDKPLGRRREKPSLTYVQKCSPATIIFDDCDPEAQSETPTSCSSKIKVAPNKYFENHPFRRFIFSEQPTTTATAFNMHLLQIYNTVNSFSKNPETFSSHMKSRQITLPDDPECTTNKKYTLLLDLDETLISKQDDINKAEYVVESLGNIQIGFNIRPFAQEFLQILHKFFEIIIFTSSKAEYANPILAKLDPTGSYISFVLDRDYCTVTKKGSVVKDLRIIKNREMANMVLVDNNPNSFAHQIFNGVPILSWTGDKNDRELYFLKDLLLKLVTSEETAIEFLQEHINLPEVIEYEIPELMKK